jgi:hypothetical protein
MSNLDTKEKVNWRLQYKLDNIFNIFMTIILAVSIYLKEDILIYVCLILSLYINVSASNFFNRDKYV